MSKLQPARGTRDLFGEDMRRMQKVIDTFRKVGLAYGFEDLATPIFEFTEVFKRPLGDASDIVSKEMYTFTDRGGEEVTLRPEFTAGVCRAFISNGMQQNLPCRLMSHGPVFRYERPQKGRYRQFHQINAELLGPADPEADVDMLALAWRILKTLGISKDVVLHLNTLGDVESRAAYRDALVTYFSAHKDKLSEDSQRRLTTNPLRILDSKDEGDRVLVADAPNMSQFLNEASLDFFNRVKAGLEAVGVPYVHDERLVRGLDYYTHTAFEFVTSQLGAQGTVLAGGRYDGLIAQLGGPATAGIGWAGGIERLSMLLAQDPGTPRSTIVLPMGDAATVKAFVVAEALRDAGHLVTQDRSGNLGKRLTRAAKANARYAVILGDSELEKGVAVVKDLDSGDQREIALAELAASLEA
ncbi:histidine--tRNA ligase [Gimibacter soli]|uniref:Histidine--tRNA ligase n=1 Tax=Gimibacter soli TaxID=3024400 RepID=A0AAF0BH90_9PROT|nr:histidine--tRNA ligase [Gimibacter soli]WCL54148.1 histidine--tRNA ligase [Gimibacter soli]